MTFDAIECPMTLGDRLIESETVVSKAGARVLTIATTSVELGVQLHDSYIGHDAIEEVLASELGEVPGMAPRVEARRLAGASLTHHRRRLLYDHLQRFQDLAAESGHVDLRVHGLGAAIARIEGG